MSDTFGVRVRKHRERRGVSLDAIAQQTKIKASLLDGLERGDISHWPSGIFRRAYVRAYAEAIGLDADAIAREFAELYPDPEIALPPPAPPQSTRVRRLLDSAFAPFSRLRTAPDPEPADAAPAPSPAPATPAAAVQNARTEGSRPSAAAAAEVPKAAPPRQPPVAGAPKLQPIDLLTAARLCTDIGQVKSSGELVPLLRDAAKLLGVRGLIVWIADAGGGELRPSIVHGYSDKVRARLRPVKRDADNATAEAFRLSETRAVGSRDNGRSALAVPLLSAGGCAGVLAIELPQERAEMPAVQAVATFIASVLALLIAGPDSGERDAERGERRAERRGRSAGGDARTA